MRVITKLEPIVPPIPRRKRVAAYARVSSGKDAMLHSLSAQVSYYSDYIQRHGEWEYAGCMPMKRSLAQRRIGQSFSG